MKVADICAKNSKAKRLNVGAILVKNQQIISDGFNGTPNGFENDCEIESTDSDGNKILVTKPYVLHAESNCLMKSLRHGISTVGSTIYVTHAPCVECSKLIIQAGVERVVYHEPYKSEDGLNILKKAKLKVEQF